MAYQMTTEQRIERLFGPQVDAARGMQSEPTFRQRVESIGVAAGVLRMTGAPGNANQEALAAIDAACVAKHEHAKECWDRVYRIAEQREFDTACMILRRAQAEHPHAPADEALALYGAQRGWPVRVAA